MDRLSAWPVVPRISESLVLSSQCSIVAAAAAGGAGGAAMPGRRRRFIGQVGGAPVSRLCLSYSTASASRAGPRRCSCS